MRMHDNGEILVLPLNNNMSPEGLLKWAPAISWHDREGVLEDEQGAEGKGGVMVLLREELDTEVADRGDK